MLTPLPEFLARLDALPAPAPRLVALDQAMGLVLAADVRAPRAAPGQARASRAGLAVASLDLVGAGAWTPAFLARRPKLVAAGDALPEGCDATLDPAACLGDGPCEIAEAPAPGQGARLAGADVAAGAILGRAGSCVGSELLLAARLTGIDALPVRAPRLAFGPGGGAGGDWLAATLSGWGCASARSLNEADLGLLFDGGGAPALGLSPGAATRLEPGVPPRLVLAPTPEACAGALAFLTPLIGRWTGRAPRATIRALTKKIASSVGLAELALLAAEGQFWRPLAVGDAPAAALLTARAFAVLPAESEGAPAGAPFAAYSIADPFSGDPSFGPCDDDA
jgi:hypothetical protein